MYLLRYLSTAITVLLPTILMAQTPQYVASVSWTHPDSEVTTESTVQGSGPITGQFTIETSDDDGWTVMCAWNFQREGTDEPYLIRYEKDTELTFSEYGKTKIWCEVKFVNANDTITYDREYWNETIGEMSVAIAESRLEMPNAFSPNGDEFNEIYKPKSNYQSIVEFHGIIVNRYGQKLFEWSDPSTGWDGTYNGRPMPDGVYYCYVKARGADGVRYSIKKDVNLLRGFSETIKE